jgi:hypothetical protein
MMLASKISSTATTTHAVHLSMLFVHADVPKAD